MKRYKARHKMSVAIERVESRVLFNILYVDANATGAVHDGSSFANGMLDLQVALAAAQAGDTIRVADGTYLPTSTTDRTISFAMKSGVSILGGYAGDGAPNPISRDVAAYPTVLSGGIGAATVNDNSYHVIIGSGTDASAVLDGFTVTGGATTASYTDSFNSNGAGIYTANGSPTISNCTFANNFAMYYGGGMYNLNSSPTITNCTFIGNFTREMGAGMCNNGASTPTISNCTFITNNAQAGSGMGRGYGGGIASTNGASPVVTNCTFTANLAGSGAAAAAYNASGSFTDCTFTGNIAQNGGAFAGLFGGSNSFLRCRFNANQAYFNGAGVAAIEASIIATNSTFVGNHAALLNPAGFIGTSVGGAGYTSTSGSLAIVNCTLAFNIAGSGAALGGDGSSGLINSISWGNFGLSNTGNDSADPQFVRNPSPGADGSWGTGDDDFGDLRLRAYSPAVDAGDNSVLAGITTDLGGGSRFIDVPSAVDVINGQGASVDMGAYEAAPALAASAGGKYSVLAGQNVNLHGLGSSDDSSTLVYSWDLNNDGTFGDATGASPIVNSASLGVGAHTITLRVTDGLAHSMTSSASITVLPSTIYVDSDATGGSNDGSSWNNAFTSLAAAMAAAVPGVTIKVGAGTYMPSSSDRTASFQLKSGVSIYGGYAGHGAANPDLRNVAAYPTTLSGDIGLAGVSADNSLHVINASGADASAILDGFFVVDGNASTLDQNSGGALISINGGASIANTTFTGNTATSGGAVAALTSTISFSGCSFISNAAATFGGAIYLVDTSLTLTGCTFKSNTAGTSGGAIDQYSGGTLSVSGSSFINNSARAGGALWLSESNSIFTNTSFTANGATSTSGGGAVYMQGSNSGDTIAFVGCSFNANRSASRGGAVLDTGVFANFTNCVFVANIAQTDGGAIALNNSNTILISNSTLTANAANRGGAIWFTSIPSSATYLNNCIVWGNTANSGAGVFTLNNTTATHAINYSIVQGGFTGNANLNADPQFTRVPSAGMDSFWGTADDDYGDLRLRLSSPAIDTGDNASVPSGITTDIAGNPRIVDVPGAQSPGAIVDRGAYERTAPLLDLEFMLDASHPSIRASFTDDALAASVAAGDIVLINLSTNTAINCAECATVSYNAGSKTATWSFSNLLADGNYRVTLPAGAVLDTNSTPLLSQNAVADFFSLAGDANHDRKVDITDLSIVSANWQGSDKTFSQGDFNYDGHVDAADLSILSGSWQKNLPVSIQVQTTAVSSRPPLRTATRVAALVL